MAGLASVWLGKMMLTFLAWNGGDGQRNHAKLRFPFSAHGISMIILDASLNR